MNQNETNDQNNRVIDKIAISIIAIINTVPNIIGNYTFQNVLIHDNNEFYFFFFFFG